LCCFNLFQFWINNWVGDLHHALIQSLLSWAVEWVRLIITLWLICVVAERFKTLWRFSYFYFTLGILFARGHDCGIFYNFWNTWQFRLKWLLIELSFLVSNYHVIVLFCVLFVVFFGHFSVLTSHAWVSVGWRLPIMIRRPKIYRIPKLFIIWVRKEGFAGLMINLSRGTEIISTCTLA